MKTRIADWLFNFWYNNHTHYWIAFDPNSLRQKCRHCGIIKKRNSMTTKGILIAAALGLVCSIVWNLIKIKTK